jgi:hypothetical protein
MIKWTCGLFLLFSLRVLAESPHLGCLIHPRDLTSVGTRAVKAAIDLKQSLPESMNVQADIDATFTEQSIDGDITWEGFYRPERNGFYTVLPLPLFGFELSRDRNVIYVCAHLDRDVSKQHFTVYLMRGYHLDPTTLNTVIGNLFSKAQLKVSALSPVILPLGSLDREGKSSDIIHLPWKMFSWQFAVVGGIQRLVSNVVGGVSGLSVERIILTNDRLELASGIDLNNPEKAFWKRTINFRETEAEQP